MYNLLIAVEGCDGSGKTTVCTTLYKYLQELNHDPVILRAMGSGVLGQAIRTALLSNQLSPAIIAQSCSLAIVDAYQTAYKHLENGQSVIMDRGIGSFYAYNVKANNDPNAYLFFKDVLLAPTIIETKPDLTFYVDAPISQLFHRIKEREGEATIYDLKSEAYFKKVKQGFKELLTLCPELNPVVIDNSGDFEYLNNQIMSALENVTKQKRRELYL